MIRIPQPGRLQRHGPVRNTPRADSRKTSDVAEACSSLAEHSSFKTSEMLAPGIQRQNFP